MSSGAGNLTSTSSSRKRRSEAMVAGTSQQQPSGSSNINSSVVVVDPFRQVENREGASGGGAAVRLKVRVRRYHGVARWIWDANDDVCGICQAAFEGVAPGVKFPGEDCPVVWGKCGHAFHLQCVSKWLSQAPSKNSCPICRQEWEFGHNPGNGNSGSNNNSADSGGGTASV